MTDRDVLERFAALVGVSVAALAARRENWKPTYRVWVTGHRFKALVDRIYPHMSTRRQAQINRALLAFEVKSLHLSEESRATIVDQLKGGDRATIIAQRFGISREHVYRLRRQADVSAET